MVQMQTAASPYTSRFVRLVSQGDGVARVDPRLRPMLVDYAAAEGMSMTTAVMQILAASFDVPYEPQKRKTSPRSTAAELNLRVPQAIDDALDAEARKRRGTSVPDVILRTLCGFFELPQPT
jgi:predicted HicB family RNase H-like nuclease